MKTNPFGKNFLDRMDRRKTKPEFRSQESEEGRRGGKGQKKNSEFRSSVVRDRMYRILKIPVCIPTADRGNERKRRGCFVGVKGRRIRCGVSRHHME